MHWNFNILQFRRKWTLSSYQVSVHLERKRSADLLQTSTRSRKPKQVSMWMSVFMPCHKMARGQLVFALSVLLSFHHSVASKFVFSTPTSLHEFEWNLVQMLYHKSWSACGEIIYVQQIFAELWPLTLNFFTHFSLSSQLLLHPCMDLNETWQRCCTTSLEVHVRR